MITGVAFCPQAPALVPEIGRGLEVELGEVRAACRAAVRRVAALGVPVLIVGAGDHTDGYGPSIAARTIGDWLVHDALGADRDVRHVTPAELAAGPLDHDVALVVLGDGSARRSEKAPGHLDPNAAGADASLARTLRDGDAGGLRSASLADDGSLLIAGTEAWAAAALPTGATTWDAELLYDDAPFGVGYFVAVWTARA